MKTLLNLAEDQVPTDSFRAPVTGDLARISLSDGSLPEHRLSWLVRPGLRGSRRGRVWLSHFEVEAELVDGTPLNGLVDRRVNHRKMSLISPKLMGSHRAPGLSRTVARLHLAGLRAATARFGHLGVEWDLSHASSAEMADLNAWISFYESGRSLLLSSDPVRAVVPSPNISAHGVVATARPLAIHSLASLGRSDVCSIGQNPLPRLHPGRARRVRPLAVGSALALAVPAWRGGPDAHTGRPGGALAGRAIAAGLRASTAHSEHAVAFPPIAVWS